MDLKAQVLSSCFLLRWLHLVSWLYTPRWFSTNTSTKPFSMQTSTFALFLQISTQLAPYSGLSWNVRGLPLPSNLKVALCNHLVLKTVYFFFLHIPTFPLNVRAGPYLHSSLEHTGTVFPGPSRAPDTENIPNTCFMGDWIILSIPNL